MISHTTTFPSLVLAAALASAAAAMPSPAPTPTAADRPLAPVILDPGHGGEDLGAVVKGVREKDIALAVARKLRDRLKADLPVVMTRDGDNYVTLDRRVVDAVDWRGSVFVSIHLNQVRNKKSAGAIVYSYGPDRKRGRGPRPRRHPLVPPMPAPPRVEARESERLAGAVVRGLREGGFLAEASKSDYYVLKNPAQPSILIELGYLSNPEEASRLNDPAYQDRLAASLAKALERYGSDRALRAGVTASGAPTASHL